MSQWDESQHPRNPHSGEFVDAGGWFGAVSDALIGRTPRRNMLEDPETDWAAISARGEEGSPWRWNAPMHRIYQIDDEGESVIVVEVIPDGD